MAAEPSLDVLQREASESPRSLLLPPALLAQRRAVLKATSRMDEGSKFKISTLVVKYAPLPSVRRPVSFLGSPPPRHSRKLSSTHADGWDAAAHAQVRGEPQGAARASQPPESDAAHGVRG